MKKYLLFFLVLFLLIFGIYYLINNFKTTKDLKKLQNSDLNFTIEYPINWTLTQSSFDRENHEYESLFFNSLGSGEPDSYSINVYKSFGDLFGAGQYENLEQWIKAQADEIFSYNKTQLLDGDTYEGYWPSVDMTYAFYTEHDGFVYNIDVTWVYPNKPEVDEATKKPIFTDQAKQFIDSFSFVK